MAPPPRDRSIPMAGAAARAAQARDRLRDLREEQRRLTDERDEAILDLSALGLSYEAIAGLAGVSRARVGQVVTSKGGRPTGGQRR